MDLILSFFQSGLSAVIPFIILLGILIFVHEMGHFLVAKFFGVRVEIFSLGFGKKILSYKKGDTTYCLSIIPLGGYVKMFGDEIGANLPEEQKKFSFTHKPVSQRIAIVLAGPLMNLFFAILIFAAVAILGEEVRTPKVGDIQASTLAHQIGFRSGDRILSVESTPVRTWDEFVHQISINTGKELTIEVKRFGSDQVDQIKGEPKLSPNPNILSLDDMVGSFEGLTNVSKASAIGVRPGTIAEKAGLRTGDVINSINGFAVSYFRELENLLIAQQGQPIKLEITRYPNVDVEKSEKLTISIDPHSIASLDSIGIEEPDLYLAKIIEKSPAQTAGLKAGDRLLAINNQPVTAWEQILATIKGFSGEGTIDFKVLRAGKEMSYSITPQMTSQMTQQGAEEKRYTIGIIPWIQVAPPETMMLKQEGLTNIMSRSVEKTWDITAMTVVSFLRLIQNKISPKNIGGVISIGQAASETFKIGITHFLQMMAIISINLFILNLLPVPVLDGGHLLFYTIEAIRGAPVSIRKMEIAQQFGLVMLMSLMAFALFNDFSRLLGN